MSPPETLSPPQSAASAASADIWTRLAWHWHECDRRRRPAAPGADRRRWEELDELTRQDAIFQLRSLMAAVVAHGRRWAPSRAVPPGSFIELTERELREVTQAEHARWYRRSRAAGLQAVGAEPAGRGAARARRDARVSRDVVPWADLSDESRQACVDRVALQLTQLEAAGFLPSVPEGGPAAAASFCRTGVVRARQLSAAWPWTGQSGSQLRGAAGDWRVIDDHGDERTVRDQEFRATHERLDDDRWRRTGRVRAWQAGESVALRTMEGRVIAAPGDWIVEGEYGARWPVRNEQFWRGHRRA